MSATNLGYIGSKPGAKDKDRDGNSWFTPSEYIEAVHRALGGIDLDPFSSEKANEVIKAKHIFTTSQSAFDHKWPKVWSCFMNPPYSHGMCGKAIDLFLANFKNKKDAGFQRGILLVNNATDTKWFQRAAEKTSAICFTNHRISFYNVDGKQSSVNTRGQAFLYFGNTNYRAKFAREFRQYGFVFLKEAK